MEPGDGDSVRRLPILIVLPVLPVLLLLSLMMMGSARGPTEKFEEAGPATHVYHLPMIRHQPLLSLSLLTADIWLPVSITHFGGERFLVTTKEGYVRVISGTNVLPTPFLDLSAEIASGIETGVYKVVLDPDFGANRYVYVSYLQNLDTSVIARYRVSTTNPNVVDPSSRQVVLTVDQPGPEHNGGALAFGPDGYLYISFGDGLCCNDPLRSSQDLSVLLGKILRIDVSTLPYTVPPDNPYVGVGGARDEIWASGLRNPWRMSFDPANGNLFISDVGEWKWEEIDLLFAGSAGGVNFGWSCYEGPVPFNTSGCESPAAYRFPILSYDHDAGCAVTGGEVYRGSAYPALTGMYFYADFCTGTIYLASRRTDGAWITLSDGPHNMNPTGFAPDGDGELLLVGFPDRIYRISPSYLP